MLNTTVVEDSLILALLSFAVDFCDYFFVDYNGGRRLLWDKRAGRYTTGALLRGGLAHAPRKASARSGNQQ